MTVTLTGNKQGIYIDPINCNAYVDYTQAINYKDVKIYGVNHLVIDRKEDGSMKIILAGGYSWMRGLFCDLY